MASSVGKRVEAPSRSETASVPWLGAEEGAAEAAVRRGVGRVEPDGGAVGLDGAVLVAGGVEGEAVVDLAQGRVRADERRRAEEDAGAAVIGRVCWKAVAPRFIDVIQRLVITFCVLTLSGASWRGALRVREGHRDGHRVDPSLVGGDHAAADVGAEDVGLGILRRARDGRVGEDERGGVVARFGGRPRSTEAARRPGRSRR